MTLLCQGAEQVPGAQPHLLRARRTELCGPAGDPAQGCMMRLRGLYCVLFIVLGLGTLDDAGNGREIVL